MSWFGGAAVRMLHAINNTAGIFRTYYICPLREIGALSTYRLTYRLIKGSFRELDDDSMDLEGVDVGFHGRSFSSAVVCAFCPRGAVWHR